LGNFFVDVQSGKLHMPFGDAATLPELHFDSHGDAKVFNNGSLAGDPTFTGLNLDGLAIDPASFHLSLSSGLFHADLQAPVGINVGEGTGMQLKTMKLDS